MTVRRVGVFERSSSSYFVFVHSVCGIFAESFDSRRKNSHREKFYIASLRVISLVCQAWGCEPISRVYAASFGIIL